MKAAEDGFICGFLVGKLEGVPVTVSLLQFSDNTIVFCDAEEDVAVHQFVLICPEAVSGLSVNVQRVVLCGKSKEVGFFFLLCVWALSKFLLGFASGCCIYV